LLGRASVSQPVITYEAPKVVAGLNGQKKVLAIIDCSIKILQNE
jgi:hypothetical protein